jgi:hypothetical protein
MSARAWLYSLPLAALAWGLLAGIAWLVVR